MLDARGNGGGLAGGFSRPGTREIINRTENQEIQADDARGIRVIVLNLVIVCLVMLSIILLGPLAVVIAFPVAVVLFAVWLSGNQETIDNATITNDPVTVIWSVAVTACVFWLFLVDGWLWNKIVDWYPFKIMLPWYYIVIAWTIIGAVLWGVRDVRISHRQSLYNRNWPPTYSQMRPEVGPYYEGGEDGSADEPTATDKAEVMAMLAEALAANKPETQYVDRLVTVNSDREKAQSVAPIAPFDGARLVRVNGCNPIRLSDIEKFCKSLDATGPTVEAWRQWRYDRWHDVVVYCASLGITTEPRIRTKTRAQMSSADALARLYAMYPKPEQDPPTPFDDAQSVLPNVEQDRQTETESVMSNGEDKTK